MSTSLAFDLIARDRASSTFQKVGKSAEGLGSSVGKSGDKFDKFDKFAKKARLGALGMGAGLALIGKKAVDLEAEFGKTMNVLTATLQAPEAKKSLTDLAMKMGAETVFSANDASKAMLELARGGMDAVDIKGGALQGTLTLAAAGELGMGEAANIAVKSMGQFNLGAKDMAGVAAALAGGANASSASVRDMSFALAQGGLAANSVGFSLQETTAVLAAFSNAGLEGSDAGTSMKTMLDRLQPTTTSAKAAMMALGGWSEKTGSAFVKANGEFKSAAEIAEILHKGTAKLSEAERKRTITQAFGSDAQRAATIFAEEGAKGLKKMLKATTDQDAAQKMAASNMQGTSGALEKMSGAIETAQLKFGQMLAPAVVKVAGVITDKAIPAVMDFMDGMRTGKGLGGDFAEILDGIKSAAEKMAPIVGGALELLVSHPDAAKVALLALAAAFVTVQAVALGHAVVMKATATATAISTAATWLHTTATAANRSLIMTWLGVKAIELGAWVASTAAKVVNTAATVASTVAAGVATVATGAWAAAQWLLNAALLANPIGLVVAGVALLVGGLILAYKKSETFRGVIDGLWNNVLKPFGQFLGSVLVGYVRLLATAWLTMAEAAVKAFRFLLGAALSVFGGILSAAEKGLGWIPGLGDKIRGAKKGFEDFKDGTLAALDKTAAALQNVKDKVDGIPTHKHISITVSQNTIKGLNNAANNSGVQTAGNALGTSRWRGGRTWVGENGPELVDLPRGARVHTAPASRSMRGDGIDYRQLARCIVDALRDGTPLVRLPDAGRGAYLQGGI